MSSKHTASPPMPPGASTLPAPLAAEAESARPSASKSAPCSVDSPRSPAEFDPVFASGSKHVQGSVSLRVLRRGDGSELVRLGLIVPKKKTKLAVLRNAFKRVAREAVRSAAAAGPLRGCDVVAQFSGLALRNVDAFKAAARADLDAALAKAMSPSPPARKPGPGRP